MNNKEELVLGFPEKVEPEYKYETHSDFFPSKIGGSPVLDSIKYLRHGYTKMLIQM